MKELDRIGVEDDAWMMTALGGAVYFLRPADSDINIEAVALHAGKLCRWGGAVSRFYSVGQHQCMVGTLIQRQLDADGISDATEEYWDQILAGLLHDGGESFTNDVVSPLKHIMGGKYDWIETGLVRELFHRYGVDWAYYNQTVNDADRLASEIERTFLLPDHPRFPKKDPATLPYRIEKEDCWGPDVAGDKYLQAVRYVMERRKQTRIEGRNATSG
jgi:hypothetical protein